MPAPLRSSSPRAPRRRYALPGARITACERYSANDDEVVGAVLRHGREPELRRELRVRRLDEDRAVLEDDRGDDCLAVVMVFDELPRFLVLLDVDPLVLDLLIAEESLRPLA